MPMSRNDLLNAVIDDGIYELTTMYTRPNQKIKRDGGIEGFEACRGKSNEELLLLLKEAQRKTRQKQEECLEKKSDIIDDYWGVVMYERQIEWTLNVLSAAMYAHGLSPVVSPTARGMRKAAEILELTS